MKKQMIAVMLLIGLSHGVILPLKREVIKRHWNCVTRPNKHRCSPQERKDAKRWITKYSLVALGAMLAAAGIAFGSIAALKKKKKEEKEKLEEGFVMVPGEQESPRAQQEKRRRSIMIGTTQAAQPGKKLKKTPEESWKLRELRTEKRRLEKEIKDIDKEIVVEQRKVEEIANANVDPRMPGESQKDFEIRRDNFERETANKLKEIEPVVDRKIVDLKTAQYNKKLELKEVNKNIKEEMKR